MLIKTKRLIIKNIELDDEESIYQIFSNASVNAYYMVPNFNSYADYQKLFKNLCTLSKDDNKYIMGLYLNTKLIGLINAVERHEESIEFGYALNPKYQHLGYLTEALKQVISLVKANGYKEVVASCFKKNEASIRVLKRCGFEYYQTIEEEIEYQGQIHDVCYYKVI